MPESRRTAAAPSHLRRGRRVRAFPCLCLVVTATAASGDAVSTVDPAAAATATAATNLQGGRNAAIGVGGGGALSSLPYLDDLRFRRAADVVRRGNVDVLPPVAGAEELDGGEIALCHLAYMFPFTSKRGVYNAVGSYEGAAAVALAAQHFNAGNGTIVPALAGVASWCPVRFTVETFDTELQESVAVNEVIRLTDRETGSTTDKKKERPPCAILGAARSAVSVPMSIVSGLRGYPQLSPISTSAALDDASQYPLFGRTIPSDDGAAVPLVLYLRDVVGLRHLGVIHVSDPYGSAYAEGIQAVVRRIAPEIRIDLMDIPVEASAGQIARAVRAMKETQYTFFFLIHFEQTIIEAVMTEAYSQNIAGTGRHNWFFSDGVGSAVTGRSFDRNSPLGLAYRGTSILSAVGGMTGMDGYDALARELAALRDHPDDRAYLASILPRYPGEDEEYAAAIHGEVINSDTFLSDPELVAPFLYDAVVALGLAACDAMSKNETSGAYTYFDGASHFGNMVNRAFSGTSGEVVFNNVTGTRDPASALFSLVNFVDDDEATPSSGTVQFKGVQSGVFRGGEWVELEPYVFNDGTTATPEDLPEPDVNENHLPVGLRATGLALFAAIAALSVGLAYWTYRNRDVKVVRASQPQFLLLICAGTVIMGSSIVPLAVDMGVSDQHGCDAACQAFPWVLCVGFSFVFSGLFTKTHRINRIHRHASRFKKVTVTNREVIKPMMVICSANIIVLIVWTVVDPLYFGTVTVTSDRFDRPTETFGKCTSGNQAIYVAVLAVINIGALVYTFYEAYVARDISTEFAESAYIFRAIALILITCFIGIPVMVISSENDLAYFFVATCLIFVVCASVLLLIFVPKVKYHHCKHGRNEVNSGQRRSRFASLKKSTGLPAKAMLAESVREMLSQTGSSSDESRANNDSEGKGVRILGTRQSQKELEKENRRLRREVACLKLGVSAAGGSRCNSIDSDSEAKLDIAVIVQPLMRRPSQVSFKLDSETDDPDNGIPRQSSMPGSQVSFASEQEKAKNDFKVKESYSNNANDIENSTVKEQKEDGEPDSD